LILLNITDRVNEVFKPAVDFLAKIFLFDPVKALGIDVGTDVPLVVIWLILGGLFFTFRMKFINIRGFRHAIALTAGKYDKPGESGEVSHFQALTTALSATVGLGNIAGVAIAISIGGPGATFWMILAGILGMSLKFTECTLGLKYRKINDEGIVSGGPMYYLEKGFADRNMKYIGKALAVIYAIIVFMASFGGGNMFQSNQAFSQLAEVVPFFKDYSLWVGIFLAFAVGLVIIGGLKSIAQVTSKIVPLMAFLYVGTALSIIIINISRTGEVFHLIITEAFSSESVKGGFIGVLIMGFKRGAFSNEAGIGSASIAHAAARTDKPVSEGLVALLEPFIDTVVICTMTAMVIIFTGFHHNTGHLEGAPLTSAAFGSVYSWFPYLLVIAILLFAYSTMISWSYYGEKGFNYIFHPVIKNRSVSSKIYQFLFLGFVILGTTTYLKDVIDFADMMILGLSFPNIIGLVILSKEVKKDLDIYLQQLKEKKITRKR
jgi:alanine or glycine:cation symporter, AGCS family